MSVLGYFLRNPACVDDLEGIARWRLLEEQVGNMVAETSLALDWLVGQGLLVRLETPGQGARYQLRANSVDKAAALLRNKATIRNQSRRP